VILGALVAGERLAGSEILQMYFMEMLINHGILNKNTIETTTQ